MKKLPLGRKKFWDVWALHMVLLVLCVGGNQDIIINSWKKSKWKKEERPLDIGVRSEKVHKKISDYFLAWSRMRRGMFTDSNDFSMLWFHQKNSRLDNQISNSFSPKEKLIKNRLWGRKWGQKFPYPWVIPFFPQWLVYTSGINVPLFGDGLTIYLSCLDCLQVDILSRKRSFFSFMWIRQGMITRISRWNKMV